MVSFIVDDLGNPGSMQRGSLRSALIGVSTAVASSAALCGLKDENHCKTSGSVIKWRVALGYVTQGAGYSPAVLESHVKGTPPGSSRRFARSGCCTARRGDGLGKQRQRTGTNYVLPFQVFTQSHCNGHPIFLQRPWNSRPSRFHLFCRFANRHSDS